MSQNFYSEIHLHITWHTIQSMPLLTPTLEPLVYRELKQKIIHTPGVYVHEIGGTETHVHLSVTVVPTITPSELIGQLKGASSFEINRAAGQKVLQWQTGYGIVSYGTKDMDWVNAYIRNQKEHHARAQTHERLERIDREDDAAAAE
jgi:putative transposase